MTRRVVIHLSKTKKKRIDISFIDQRQQSKTPNKPPRQNFNSDSDSDRQRSHKTLLTEIGVESGEMHNIKVIENFDTFPESINTPSHDQQFRNYDHCKLGVLLQIHFWIDQATWTNLDFKPTSNGKLT
jgi:hypothetical protein